MTPNVIKHITALRETHTEPTWTQNQQMVVFSLLSRVWNQYLEPKLVSRQFRSRFRLTSARPPQTVNFPLRTAGNCCIRTLEPRRTWICLKEKAVFARLLIKFVLYVTVLRAWLLVSFSAPTFKCFPTAHNKLYGIIKQRQDLDRNNRGVQDCVAFGSWWCLLFFGILQKLPCWLKLECYLSNRPYLIPALLQVFHHRHFLF